MRTQRKAPVSELKLRLPKALRDTIETAALARGVSMNTEMVERLSAAYKPEDAENWARPLGDREHTLAYLSILRGLQSELGSFSKAIDRVEELHRAGGLNVDAYGEPR